jgi:hypothetical protein
MESCSGIRADDIIPEYLQVPGADQEQIRYAYALPDVTKPPVPLEKTTAANTTNFFTPDGLTPFLARARRVPLRMDALSPDAINPPARTVLFSELYKDPFTPNRRNQAGQWVDDLTRQRIQSTSTTGPHRWRNDQQPGSAEGQGRVPEGYANGLILVPRTTNKHEGRIRILHTTDAEHVVYKRQAPNRTRTIGMTHETMTGGEIRLPRNLYVRDLDHRDPIPTTSASSARTWASARADPALGGRIRNRARIPSLQAGDFAHEMGFIRRNARSAPSLSSATDTSTFVAALVTSDHDAGYFGAPGTRAGAQPALRQASMTDRIRTRRRDRLALSQTPLVGPVFRTMSRAETHDRSQNYGPVTMRSETAGKQPLVGPLRLRWGVAAEVSLLDGHRAIPGENNLRATAHKSLISRAPTQDRSGLRVQNQSWLEPYAARRRHAPQVEHYIDPVMNSAWLNNPYRNQPVGDGNGGWLAGDKSSMTRPPFEGNVADFSSF